MTFKITKEQYDSIVSGEEWRISFPVSELLEKRIGRHGRMKFLVLVVDSEHRLLAEVNKWYQNLDEGTFVGEIEGYGVLPSDAAF